MLKPLLVVSMLFALLAPMAYAGGLTPEARNTRTIAKPKAPSRSGDLGRDPSVCGDDEAIARIAAQDGSTPRVFDNVGRHTEESDLGRTLEAHGYTTGTITCLDEPTSVVIFIRNGAMDEADRRANGKTLSGGVTEDDDQDGPETSPDEGGGRGSNVPGSYFRYSAFMTDDDIRNTFEEVIGSCDGIYQQNGDYSLRPNCLGAANAEGCERFHFHGVTCDNILASKPKDDTSELIAKPGSLTMTDCPPGNGASLKGKVTARTKAKAAPAKKQACEVQMGGLETGQMDDTPSDDKPAKLKYVPGERLPGNVDETAPIRIGDQIVQYSVAQPYYNGAITVEGLSDPVELTIDVSQEQKGIETHRKMVTKTGKPRHVEGVIEPVTDENHNLIGLKFKLTRVSVFGEDVHAVKKAKPVTLKPSRQRTAWGFLGF